MIFDIETDVTWLQCQPCLHCYEQPDSIFDPSLSSSYTLISCETKRCNLLKNSSCSVDGYCKYKISYNDDSYTAGIFVNETISFESSGWVNRVSLGCGHSNKGAFVGSAGTFGLGRGPFSFLSRINVSSMSYCLVDRNWVYSSATLEFNSPSSSSYNNDNSFKAKLLKNPKMESLYCVGFTGVSVGSERITIPNSTFTIDPYGNGGMIVSTGTIITRLETQAYNAVRDAFVAKTQHLERAKALYPFDTCYSLTTKNTIELPMMGFEVNDGKMWLLPKESYLYAVDNNGTFCFAFGPSEGPFSILATSVIVKLENSLSMAAATTIEKKKFMGPSDWNIYLLSGDKFENKVKLDLPPSFQIPNIGVAPIRVLGSAINGIICIYDHHGVPTTTVLWNPVTEEIIQIPLGHAEFIPEFTTQIFPHGFGYDHIGDDYKIIQHVDYTMVNENPLDDLEMEDVMMPDPFWEIYSLKSN
ncbi:unnamed protein product [Trifolium pratense]|uniref:Uncharacterized protein n=1 Tax=Trifolium pratense TaxID=57577 RepID=A0ACB0JLW3_TRIPR|nr:unnamed protein product [Trifolium pratense]